MEKEVETVHPTGTNQDLVTPLEPATFHFQCVQSTQQLVASSFSSSSPSPPLAAGPDGDDCDDNEDVLSHWGL